MTDPPNREDGGCALEACSKKITPPKRRRDVPDRLYADPFCSTVCAKVYFGVPQSSYSESQGLGSPKGRKRGSVAA